MAQCVSVATLFEAQTYEKKTKTWLPTTPQFWADAHGLWPLPYVSKDSRTAAPTAVPDLPGWAWAPEPWTVRTGKAFLAGGPVPEEDDGWLYAAGFNRKGKKWTTTMRGMLGMAARGNAAVRVRCWARPVVASAETASLMHAAVGDDGGGHHPRLHRVPCVRFTSPKTVVYVVHGIGIHGHSNMKSKLSTLRVGMADLQDACGLNIRDARIEWDYVSWHMDGGDTMEDDVLNSDGEDTAEDVVPPRTEPDVGLDLLETSLDAVMLDTMTSLRGIVKTTLVDAALYFSPAAAAGMRSSVVRTLNRRWALFKACHPLCDFDAVKACLFGHSLGGVICWDLLTADTVLLDLPVRHLFTAGSPVGFFLSVRMLPPEGLRALTARLESRGIAAMNLFNSSDPIAFRLAPLFTPGVDYHTIAAPEAVAVAAFNARVSVGDGPAPAAAGAGSTAAPPPVPPPRTVSLASSPMAIPMATPVATPPSPGGPKPTVQDAALPAAGMASLNKYLHLATSHSCYWDSQLTLVALSQFIV